MQRSSPERDMIDRVGPFSAQEPSKHVISVPTALLSTVTHLTEGLSYEV